MNTKDLVTLLRQYCELNDNDWLAFVIHEDGSVTIDDVDLCKIVEDFSSVEKAVEHMNRLIEESSDG